MGKYFGLGDDVPFEVYITPLDNQKTSGEWVSFPTTPETLRDVFERLEIGPSEWNITNVEAHIYGIRDTVWQCNSLDELNYLAAKLEELSEDELGTYQAVIEIDEHCDTVPELINLTDNLDCYDVEAEISDYEDLARYVLYERDSYSYNRNTLDALEDYIDFDEFGRDVAKDEGGVLADACYVCPTGCSFVENYNGNPATIPEKYRVTQRIIIPELTDDERLEKAISLAVDLDLFFREFDPAYVEQHPNIQLQQEALCDSLFDGKLAAIDAMLDDLVQGEHDVLPSELAEYKAAIRYDPAKDVPETMKVLVVEPRKAPYVAEIQPGAESLSEVVGGPIAATYPFDDMVAVVCNDDARAQGQELNRALYNGEGRIYDVIPGTFVITGLSEDSFASLPDDLAEKFTRRFQTIEVYAQVGNRTVMFQVPQDNLADLSNRDLDSIIQSRLDRKPSIRDRLEAAKKDCAAKPSVEHTLKYSDPEL